ncbi:MAG TPA: hypothetical protein DDX84_02720, partial [Nitrospiraceae bacterium]|nr:hypothetical protein [Nitrospiraceae bacterium]
MKRFLPIIGIIGLFTVAAGGITYAISGAMESYIIALLWAGLLILLFYFYVSFPELRTLLTLRSAKYGANTVVMIIIFITMIGVVSFFTTRYKVRWDLTKT